MACVLKIGHCLNYTPPVIFETKINYILKIEHYGR